MNTNCALINTKSIYCLPHIHSPFVHSTAELRNRPFSILNHTHEQYKKIINLVLQMFHAPKHFFSHVKYFHITHVKSRFTCIFTFSLTCLCTFFDRRLFSFFFSDLSKISSISAIELVILNG